MQLTGMTERRAADEERKFDAAIAAADLEDARRAAESEAAREEAELDAIEAAAERARAVDAGAKGVAPVPELRGELSSVEAVARFALAGQALLTLENEKTGARYTYRLERARAREEGQDEGARPIFVSVLVDSDNTSRRSYRYVGLVWTNGPRPTYRHGGAKAKIGADAPSARGAEWLLGRIASGQAIPAPMRLWHEGRCGRCGRTLTVPSSIASGLGPVCAERGA